MDGFEVARRLKADAATAHIPIIFMTGLTETEHLVAALEAGGSDYVTKPIRPKEVMARMQVHLQAARERRQTRNALDALGYASITVRVSDGQLMWQTPQAREMLARYFGASFDLSSPVVPEPVWVWLRRSVMSVLEARAQGTDLPEPPRMSVELGARRLSLRLQSHQDAATSSTSADWLIIMQEVSDQAVIEAITNGFKLTAKEAEVLYWVVKGKINRDIADILGSSPATVKKHLERILAKMGVETRTAAAAMAINRIRQLQPQMEG
jgi:DNA-binding NarL/FixJ family response regulator